VAHFVAQTSSDDWLNHAALGHPQVKKRCKRCHSEEEDESAPVERPRGFLCDDGIVYATPLSPRGEPCC
jgi:ligand-binding sensor protein